MLAKSSERLKFEAERRNGLAHSSVPRAPRWHRNKDDGLKVMQYNSLMINDLWKSKLIGTRGAKSLTAILWLRF
jgi:hypothetical protein